MVSIILTELCLDLVVCVTIDRPIDNSATHCEFVIQPEHVDIAEFEKIVASFDVTNMSNDDIDDKISGAIDSYIDSGPDRKPPILLSMADIIEGLPGAVGGSYKITSYAYIIVRGNHPAGPITARANVRFEKMTGGCARPDIKSRIDKIYNSQ